MGAQWTFLSDPGRTVQQDLDIQEYTDPEHDPMIPHTLVLKPGLVVHSVYNGYWFWGRPSVPTSGTTCGRFRVRSAPTGISANPGSVKPGMRATSRPSTAGIEPPTEELWNQSSELNAQRHDHPPCPGAVVRLPMRGAISCQHALYMLRWLRRAPEDFLTGPVADVGDTGLPDELGCTPSRLTNLPTAKLADMQLAICTTLGCTARRPGSATRPVVIGTAPVSRSLPQATVDPLS